MVGAILTQHAAWANAERALEALRARGLLSPEALSAIAERDLAQAIRPAGSFRRKAAALKALMTAAGPGPSDLRRFLSLPREPLRAALLSVRGIGPETADAIALYAARVPVFVVDAYTRRFVERHGIVRPSASYAEIQEAFEQALPPDVPLFSEFHALLVRLGKDRCRPEPRCVGCPLESDLGTRARARSRSRTPGGGRPRRRP